MPNLIANCIENKKEKKCQTYCGSLTPTKSWLSLSSHCWFGSISSSGSQSVLGLVCLLVICQSPVSSDESSGYHNTQPPSFLTHLLHFFPTLQYSAIKVSRQFSNLGVFLLPSLASYYESVVSLSSFRVFTYLQNSPHKVIFTDEVTFRHKNYKG